MLSASKWVPVVGEKEHCQRPLVGLCLLVVAGGCQQEFGGWEASAEFTGVRD